MGDHRKVQMNELNELRDQAYENSLINKEKMKKIHDSKLKNCVFNVGLPDYEDSHAREIPSGESKVHIEVLSVLWGNRLPIPDGSLPLSRNWSPVIDEDVLHARVSFVARTQQYFSVKAGIDGFLDIAPKSFCDTNEVPDDNHVSNDHNILVDETIVTTSVDKLLEAIDVLTIGEDSTSFLSELHGHDVANLVDGSGTSETEISVGTPEVLNGLSITDSEPYIERPFYDP
ncbi:hypothetical protein Tco_0503701 [Tanacetum coccineum]